MLKWRVFPTFQQPWTKDISSFTRSLVRSFIRSFIHFFCWLVYVCGMAMSWFFMKNAFRYFSHIDKHTSHRNVKLNVDRWWKKSLLMKWYCCLWDYHTKVLSDSTFENLMCMKCGRFFGCYFCYCCFLEIL